MIYGILRFCIDAFIVYIVYILAKDIAKILFGRRQVKYHKPYVVTQPSEKKEEYHDVQDAKFKEQHP